MGISKHDMLRQAAYDAEILEATSQAYCEVTSQHRGCGEVIYRDDGDSGNSAATTLEFLHDQFPQMEFFEGNTGWLIKFRGSAERDAFLAMAEELVDFYRKDRAPEPRTKEDEFREANQMPPACEISGAQLDSPPEPFDMDKFIKDLDCCYDSTTTQYTKDVVAGNLRNLYRKLRDMGWRPDSDTSKRLHAARAVQYRARIKELEQALELSAHTAAEFRKGLEHDERAILQLRKTVSAQIVSLAKQHEEIAALKRQHQAALVMGNEQERAAMAIQALKEALR